jgi:hypothetical protein
MADYLPEVAQLDARIFPPAEALVGWLGGEVQVAPVPLHRDTSDRMLGSLWAHPERALDERARANTSGFARMPPDVAQRAVTALRRDLADGSWDARHGAMRTLDEYDDDARASEKRTGSRPLTHAETGARLARARNSCPSSEANTTWPATLATACRGEAADRSSFPRFPGLSLTTGRCSSGNESRATSPSPGNVSWWSWRQSARHFSLRPAKAACAASPSGVVLVVHFRHLRTRTRDAPFAKRGASISIPSAPPQRDEQHRL